MLLLSPSYSFGTDMSRITAKTKKLELQKDELQGGAIAILYKGEVIYKTTFGNQKGNSGVIYG
ncbi:hypothetical protein [Rickettsia koreansis]|uniref:hypothetical protein n=1 Tax=Rickettsia koreansis TaxID=2358204 RepID=UPI003978F055